LAKDPVYFRAASSTRNVGRHVAGVIDKLVEERGTSVDNVHVIGHSLGAHTSGFAGLYTRSGKLSRVTGLDPAKPGFTDQQPDKLLDPSDAQFVDIIHTCAGLLGSDLNLGHVDFWPNGGISSQPGCNGWMEMVGSCSHGRSYEFFAESINDPESLMAFPCKNNEDFLGGKCNENAIPMGDPTPRDAAGNYFLNTKDESPFGRGLKIFNN
jgi:pimeloyl-ACP methyl ester carboxylesterase